jgi:hypothetical protein
MENEMIEGGSVINLLKKMLANNQKPMFIQDIIKYKETTEFNYWIDSATLILYHTDGRIKIVENYDVLKMLVDRAENTDYYFKLTDEEFTYIEGKEYKTIPENLFEKKLILLRYVSEIQGRPLYLNNYGSGLYSDDCNCGGRFILVAPEVQKQIKSNVNGAECKMAELYCGNERPPRKVFCQLKKGHKGSHRAVIYWE